MRYLFVLLVLVSFTSCDNRAKQPRCDDFYGLDITSDYAIEETALDTDALKREALGILISSNSRIPDNYSGVAFECENGKVLFVGSYKYGKADGVHRRWLDNGPLVGETNWKDGKAEGTHRMWHENGQLREEYPYKDSKRNGIFREWYENGQLKEEANYKDGKKNGFDRRWYKNGQLESEKNWKDGENIDDKIVYYNEDGAIKGTEYLENGKRVGCEGTCYDRY